MITQEKEQLVLLDWTAEGSAGLVALQPVGPPGKEIPGVDVVVADEPEGVTVETVRARLGHRIDRRSGMSSVGGVLRAGGKPKFLQRVRER